MTTPPRTPDFMKRLPALLLAFAAACARTSVLAPPVSHAIPAPLPPAATVPAVSDTATLPKNWQLLDEASDHWPGISSERAMRELLANAQPRRTVLVAVIDGGLDTAHRRSGRTSGSIRTSHPAITWTTTTTDTSTTCAAGISSADATAAMSIRTRTRPRASTWAARPGRRAATSGRSRPPSEARALVPR